MLGSNVQAQRPDPTFCCGWRCIGPGGVLLVPSRMAGILVALQPYDNNSSLVMYVFLLA